MSQSSLHWHPHASFVSQSSTGLPLLAKPFPMKLTNTKTCGSLTSTLAEAVESWGCVSGVRWDSDSGVLTRVRTVAWALQTRDLVARICLFLHEPHLKGNAASSQWNSSRPIRATAEPWVVRDWLPRRNLRRPVHDVKGGGAKPGGQLEHAWLALRGISLARVFLTMCHSRIPRPGHHGTFCQNKPIRKTLPLKAGKKTAFLQFMALKNK